MEVLILSEVSHFKDFMEVNQMEHLNLHNKLNLPILNALWNITVGERFEYNNPRLLDLTSRLSKAIKLFSDPSQFLLTAYPWISKLCPSLLGLDYVKSTIADIIDLVCEKIHIHEETLDVHSPRDFIDMMLIEIRNSKDTSSSFYDQLGMDNLKGTLFDLFLAGSETTSTTLTWAFLYMVRHPEVQQKVQVELDNVVGVNRSPSMSDKPNLPYTEAVLMEIQRCANIFPLGAKHIM